MQDQELAFTLILLAFMLLASYLFNLFLGRLRTPSLLAPFVVGLVFQAIPFLSPFTSLATGEIYYFLAQLGIIFLLFLVGLQLNVKELRSLSKHIVVLSILNIVFSSFLGFFVLSSFGYPPLLSIIVSTALATVAETTIAPILDELGVIRTKVAILILCPGIVDDVVEVMLASLASLIIGVIGVKETAVSFSFLALGLFVFLVSVFIFQKLVLPLTVRFNNESKDAQLFLLMISIALIFPAISQIFELGVLLGAIVAGLMFQKFINKSNYEPKAMSTLRTITYGFLGPVFFFGIGLSVSLYSLAESLQLTLWLLAVNFLGKFLGAIIVGRMAKLDLKAIVSIGLGLSAKFSMGIIPVQILYSAKVINQQLFSAFVAVSAVTTMIIPFTLSYIINRWRSSIC